MTATPSEKTVVPLSDKRTDAGDAAPVSAELGNRLASVQDLLFGDAQREIVDRLDHSDDRHREFADSTALQIQALTEMYEKKIEALREELRAIDRAQTAKRRKLVGDLGDAVKAMAYDA